MGNDGPAQFWRERHKKGQRKTAMLLAGNNFEKFKTLEQVDATGAIEIDAPVSAIELGYEFLQRFYAGRNLRHVPRRMEMIPWLFKARFYSKKWEQTWDIHPPYYDHCRYFVDRDTNQRTVTIQPYSYPDYERGDRQVPTMDEFLERVRVDSEKFASEHGLSVKLSKNGWYNPGKVILVEYTRD
jgi:hypothetical protein